MILMKKLAAYAVACVLLAAFSSPLAAQGFDYNQIGISIESENPEVAIGGSGVLVITLDAPFGFTITDIEGVFDIVPMGEIPGFTFGDLQKPPPDKVDEVGGHFEGITTIRMPFTVSADAETGEQKVVLGFRLQACDDASGQCFLPTRPEDIQHSTTLLIVEDSGGASTATTTSGGSLEDQFRNALTGGNLWIAIVLAIFAGILTSLTPCVYPMIPITISYVSGKAEGKKKNGFFISLVLVLGIAITYSVLGIIAAMTGGTFGTYINHPIVQAVIAVVLTAMGLSFLGAFEISMPSSMQQKMSTQKSGYVGALFVGLTIGFIAAPCVAPILVIMLTWIATTQNIMLGFLLMFSYAVGMGLLFIFVGTFSNAVLPRSGNWMNWMKKIFAFVFFLIAAIYAQGLINMIYPDLSQYVIGAILVIWGTVLGAFFRMEKEAGWWEMLGKSAGILLVIVGVIIFASGFIKPLLPQGIVSSGGGATETASYASPPWITDFETGLRQMEETGKPMLLDVTAEWCIACHELDQFTFSDPRIIAELERFVVVKIDGTHEDDPAYQKVKDFYAEKGYPIVGLPAVYFHNSDGEIVDVINKFEDADTALPKLEAVN